MDYKQQKRYQEARKRIISPEEKEKRDELLSKRNGRKNSKSRSKKNNSKVRQSNQQRRNKSNPASTQRSGESQTRAQVHTNHMENNGQRVRTPRKPGKSLGEFIIIFLAGIIVILSLNLLFWVQEIEVRNNDFVTNQEVIKYVRADKAAVNSLFIWGKYTLSSPSYPVSIDDISVKFKWPWSLILIVENTPIVGGVLIDEKYVYFSQDGLVITITETIREGEPIIEGLEVSQFDLYKKMSVKDEDIFDNILVLRNILDGAQIIPEEIQAHEDEISILINGIRVQLGSSNYEEKILHMVSILEELEGQTGVLNLSKYSSDSQIITFK